VFDDLAANRPAAITSPSASSTTSPATSLEVDPQWTVAAADGVAQAVFYGLGADGTVGANKNSIKIIGEDTPMFAQGYFVYDSKKSGSMTVSHLRFGPQPIRSTYLIRRADFIACHFDSFLERYDLLADAVDGRGVPAQHAPPRRRGVGASAARGAAAYCGQAPAVLRDRRHEGGRRCRAVAGASTP
jgi:pyruvate-ferredoxin/flavodoxin oxidoreductase